MGCGRRDVSLGRRAPGVDLGSSASLDVRLRATDHGALAPGHPWALLGRVTGEVARLEGAHRRLIGMPGEPRLSTYVDFDPASLLLAYADLVGEIVTMARQPDDDGDAIDEDVTAVLVGG
jgi:hypothetical protein